MSAYAHCPLCFQGMHTCFRSWLFCSRSDSSSCLRSSLVCSTSFLHQPTPCFREENHLGTHQETACHTDTTVTCGLSLPARPEGHEHNSSGDILNFQQVGLPLWLDLIPHCAAGNWLVVLCDQILILGHLLLLLLLEGSQRQASARAACRLTGSKQPTSTLRMHHSPSSIICDMLHVRTAEVALLNSGAYLHHV